MDTSNIDNWPEGVVFGAAEIKERGNTSILSKVELNEYNGFTNPNRKAEYLSVRHLFYSMLDEMNLPRKETKLQKYIHGKPYATNMEKEIHVSFSHSHEYVFCAISEHIEIGLDAEHINRKINKRILSRIINEEEKLVLADEPPVKIWTLKEAVVKCLGTGLRTNLNEITISNIEKNRFSARINDDICFEICSFTQSDHQLALAYQI